MKFNMGEREITSTLVVNEDTEDKLNAQWQSQRGEHEITNLKYERGKLTFNRKSKFQDRQWESTFEGTIQGNKKNTVSS